MTKVRSMDLITLNLKSFSTEGMRNKHALLNIFKIKLRT